MSNEKLRKALYLSQERVYTPREGPSQLLPDEPGPGYYGTDSNVRYYGGHRYRDPGMEVEEPRKRVLAAMGVPYKRGNIIPKDAEGIAVVEGVTFKLKRHVPKGMARRPWGAPGLRPIKTSKHRLYAECPVCGKEVPVGRMHQHAVVHGLGDVEGHRRRYERMKARNLATKTRRSR